MALDLTGLNPIRQRSAQLLDESFQPGGGVPQEELTKLINQNLWGTGESAGVYSQMARRGLNELQPETMYASSRTVQDSIQKLADQYAARQRSAIETGRTTEMVEPNFRLTEAGVTGEYGGTPTLANTLGSRELDIRSQEAATRSKQLEEELNWRQNLLLGSMAGGLLERTGLLDWLFGTQGRAGGGGLLGTATGTATTGLLPSAVKWIGEQLGFGSDIAKYTPEQRALIDSMTRQDAMVELMNMGQGVPAGDGGGGAGGAVSGVGAANTVSGMVGGPTIEGLLAGAPAASTAAQQAAYIEMARQAAMEELAAMGGPTAAATGSGVGASLGPAAPSIEAGLVEMLGPELAAQLGYSIPAVAAGALPAGIFAGGASAAAAGYPMAAGASTSLGLGGAAGPIGLTLAPIIMGAMEAFSGKPAYAREKHLPAMLQLVQGVPGGDEQLIEAIRQSDFALTPPTLENIRWAGPTLSEMVPGIDPSSPYASSSVASVAHLLDAAGLLPADIKNRLWFTSSGQALMNSATSPPPYPGAQWSTSYGWDRGNAP